MTLNIHKKNTPPAYFITGTDTDVGKTYVASALLRHFVALGFNALGMKPVAAGCELVNGGFINEDVVQLTQASNIKAPLALVNPYAFVPAIAPHIAAKLAGITISLSVISQAFEALSQLADVVIVEGAGGFCVPLNAHETMADLAVKLNLPVILVVGMRLGCINHALLTVQSIEARGLVVAGWVANQVHGEMTAYQDNVETLKRLIKAPCLAEVKWNQAVIFDLKGFSLNTVRLSQFSF